MAQPVIARASPIINTAKVVPATNANLSMSASGGANMTDGGKMFFRFESVILGFPSVDD